MLKPLVAIVGRPNVGKSTLFNKIAGHRISIVEDTPSITRDRIYADAEWTGKHFKLVDTGGIEPESKDAIPTQMKRQAQIAIDTADVILFVVNIRDGVTATDMDVSVMLQKAGKPIIVVSNKADSGGAPPLELYEFYNLGLGEPFPVSSIHGLGLGDLLDEVVAHFPHFDEEQDQDNAIKVALVGKPNVGKSSLVNYMLGEERAIVSDVPGTTRDALDSVLEVAEDKYLLIDTAGMRKRGRIYDNVERYSVIRSLNAVERSDVCLIMLDANQDISEQDTKIAGFAHENGRASIIVVNKWDMVDKDHKTALTYTKIIQEKLSFMRYAPVIFISAKTGQRVDKLFELIKFVHAQHGTRISTGALNDILNEAIAKVQPPSDKGKRLKLYYITQPSTRPPTFVLFVNSKELAHFSYIRYIENQIRTSFGMEGTPVRIIIREKQVATQKM